MTDHEINLALARFMGFEELPAEYAAFRRAFARCRREGKQAFLAEETGRLSMASGGFWEPLSNPAQALAVLAEAAGRGWRFELDGSDTDCGVCIVHATGIARATDNHDLPESFCRAICRAVVAAIEATNSTRRTE